MEFKKATLQEVSSQPSPTPKTVGDPIPVQINPASLRLAMANNVDAGKAFARPNTQYQGSSSSTLSFDLMFDTADEGTTEEPVDVRTRTRQLERFLLPSTDSPKAVPPRVQFTYGTLTVVGVMSALNQELDFFAPNGVPLRAKCAITIKEQKPEFDAKQAGPGANTGAGATPPLPPSAGGAGPSPTPPPADRTGTALDGESASDFASRMGLDPAAWKGFADALSDPLRLEAGLEIDFSASLSLDVGLGVEIGATAGLSVGSSGSSGDDDRGADVAAHPRPPSPVPASAPADGPSLTAKGGLSRAMAKATTERTTQAATKSREAFASDLPAPKTTSAASAPTPALQRGAAPSVPNAPPAPTELDVDRRSSSYGFGVPLRERRGAMHATSVGLVHERRRGVTRAADSGVPVTDDTTVPGWEALGPVGRSDLGSGSGPAGGASGCGCGCGGATKSAVTSGCGCGGGS